MQLSIGDYISGKSISIGKYLGENTINDITFHKIFDTSKNLVIYVPVGNESELRKLPSKGTVEKYLNMFKDQEVIDCQEIDGSRYKYLKEKVSQGGGIIAWGSFLAITAFTPLPFKLITITSGFVHFNLIYFVTICFLARGSRFFLISVLIGKFGQKIKLLLEKKLLRISIIFTILIIVAAFILYFLLKKLMLI